MKPRSDNRLMDPEEGKPRKRVKLSNEV